ncbi:MAG: Fur family transcriptional regulator [Pleomorphochaeta sp.]
MRSNGYKTKNKEYIIDILENHLDTTLSADEILEYLKVKGKNMNITTIYRNLEKLAKNNIVLKFPSTDGTKNYYQLRKHNYIHEDHLHLQCTECGKVIHLDCDTMQKFVEHLQKDHNFDLTCASSILFGLCEDCKKKNKHCK